MNHFQISLAVESDCQFIDIEELRELSLNSLVLGKSFSTELMHRNVKEISLRHFEILEFLIPLCLFYIEYALELRKLVLLLLIRINGNKNSLQFFLENDELRFVTFHSDIFIEPDDAFPHIFVVMHEFIYLLRELSDLRQEIVFEVVYMLNSCESLKSNVDVIHHRFVTLDLRELLNPLIARF